MYVASQYSHLYGRSPSCTDCMWTVKTRLFTYFLLHTSQITGALEASEWRALGTFSCTLLMWRFRWVFWVNFHKHWSHSKGLSPVWLLWWLCRKKRVIAWILNSLYRDSTNSYWRDVKTKELIIIGKCPSHGCFILAYYCPYCVLYFSSH